MAEALLRHRLEQVDPTVTVSSAGLHPGDRPATAHGVATMADRGLDIGSHRSRTLTRELLGGADLIIGMAREHVREVAVTEPDALDRTFTLKELVRAAEADGRRRPAEAVGEWLGRIGRGRRPDDLLGVGHDDAYDIEDPIGRGRADYEATADELDALLSRLVALAWPTADLEDGQERSA
jgi:protein-tyrosine phosphatase